MNNWKNHTFTPSFSILESRRLNISFYVTKFSDPFNPILRNGIFQTIVYKKSVPFSFFGTFSAKDLWLKLWIDYSLLSQDIKPSSHNIWSVNYDLLWSETMICEQGFQALLLGCDQEGRGWTWPTSGFRRTKWHSVGPLLPEWTSKMLLCCHTKAMSTKVVSRNTSEFFWGSWALGSRLAMLTMNLGRRKVNFHLNQIFVFMRPLWW